MRGFFICASEIRGERCVIGMIRVSFATLAIGT